MGLLKLLFRIMLIQGLLIGSPSFAASESSEGACSRIVSLAPSITETVFALGLGGSLVGATPYCAYPPEARLIRRVGGLIDPNFELLLRLRPSLVLTTTDMASYRERLEKLDLPVLMVNHGSVAGIRESIERIARHCGAEQHGQRLLDEIDSQVAKTLRAADPQTRPRVLVAIGELDSAGPTALYISGKDGFYSEMLTMAGARNVFELPTMGMASVSYEGLLKLDPDVIIQIGYPGGDAHAAELAAISAWARYSKLRAVRAGRIVYIADDFASIPGPRYPRLLERIVAAVHSKSK